MIGNGNVALDVARMLALTPEELAPTDTTDAAIEAISSSRIAGHRRRSGAAARRRPRSRPPELAELGDLAGADVVVDPAELELDAATSAARRPTRASSATSRSCATSPRARRPASRRRVRLRFLASPVAIHGEDRVEAVEIVRNRLEERDGRVVAVPTDERETIPCGLVFRSVGYRGVALPDVPFDEARGTIRNDCGRVLDDDGQHVSGVYCAGWIKRGPTGIIGTNKKDATETVELLLEDVRAGKLVARRARNGRSRRRAARRARRPPRRLLGLAGRSTRSSARAASRSAGRA